MWAKFWVFILPYIKLYFKTFGFTRINAFFKRVFNRPIIWKAENADSFENGWYWYKSIINKALLKADPLGFVAKYCKEQGFTQKKTTQLKNQTKEYLALTAESTKETSDLEHFLYTPEPTRKEIIKSQ